MIVKLSMSECLHAAVSGSNRRIRHIHKGNAEQHRWGYDGSDNWTTHIEGAGAEMAVAKMLDRYFTDAPAPDYEGDIGKGIQVRHTLRADGRLILHPEDKDDHIFFLVRGQMPEFDVVGWITGEDGKVAQFWADPGTGRPAFFIPADSLAEWSA